MHNELTPIRLKFLLGWAVLILLGGCFRSVPVEPSPEMTDPVVISERIESESFYFDPQIEKWIVTAVVSDEPSNGIKAIFTVEGRFTQQDHTELLSLVDGIPGGQMDEAYWVVLQEVNQVWRVVGVSEPVSANFRSERVEITPPYWMPPQLLDFNHDGIQEVFIPFHEEQGDWRWDSVQVYWFDGEKWGKLDWSMIVSQDNTRVPVSNLALPYRYIYQVKWGLEDRDNDQVDEILMNETVVYYGLNEKSQTFDLQNVLGKRDQERVFKWGGNVFEPDSSGLSFNQLDFTGSGALFPWWNGDEFPEMVFAEYLDGGLPSIHFTAQGENERIVSVTEWEDPAAFQLLGGRVYYPGGVVESEGVTAIPVPGLPGTLHVLASPDETQLAWLFVSELGGSNNDLVKGVNATLLVSNVAGDSPKVIWTMEQKDVSAWYSLLGWSGDGRQIYLGQTADIEAFPWRNFSGLLAVDSKSGMVTRIGEQINRVEIALSPDEAWLVQVEQLGQADNFGLKLNFKSRVTGLVWEIDSVESAVRVGNFLFSPGEKEVVWQEWFKVDSGEYVVIRGLILEDGLPREIYRSQTSRPIGIIRGWVDEERFVLVEDAGQGGSYLISVENGQKVPLSPYAFLGVR